MDNIPAGYDENGERFGFGDMIEEPKGDSPACVHEDILWDLDLEVSTTDKNLGDLEYENVSK